MQLHLFGVRGSLPTPGPAHVRYGGNTSCVGVAPDGELPTIILDAGTGLATARRLFNSNPFLGTLFLGHLHWDHIYGLPFFPPGDRFDCRVDLFLPAQGDPIEALERPMSPPVFPIGPRGLRGEWSFHALEPGELEVEGCRVIAREIPHKGGRSFGYRIDDGEKSIAYLSDHSPISLGDGPDGIGEYHENAMELAADVDMLIHDAQYTPEEFEERKDWGHCSIQYPIELGHRAGARKILLFHHDPSHDDDFLDKVAEEVAAPDVALAVEGTVIQL
jgi:phosphoribosyl 1,2-cyclic phosphodiesterase